MLKRIAVCGFVGLSLSIASAIASVSSYDAVADFPTGITASTSAQNGVWSYGYSNSLNPVNFLPDLGTSDYFGDGKAAGFAATGGSSLPTILKNLTAGLLDESSITDWPTNLLLLHPGSDGAYSIVRFTAPTAASYSVSGEFMPLDSGVTVDSATITTSLPSSSTLYSRTSTDTPYTFAFTTTLLAGQSLDFAVGLGPEGQFNNDSTGFDARISATPEPGFYGALALGLSGLAFVGLKRRSRKA